MDNIYKQLSVQSVINAAGTLTRLGGSLMAPEVTAAMALAARQHVPIDRLQAAVGARIAEVTATEAALVTTGAAGALTLAAAACLSGMDRGKMDRLPQTEEMPNEIIIPRSHRNPYDHALRAAGARLVEVGLAERTRDPQPWEIEAAVSDRTVAITYCVGFSPLGLDEVVQVARRHSLPLIVDAAAALPPKANLTTFTDAGADLVAFSGGKAIRGPQASGILCGRKELIASAALQMWDMDYLPELWDPPEVLIDPGYAARGVPNHGLGRGLKVGKEEIVGLWAALERFVAMDEEAECARLDAIAGAIASGLEEPPGFRVELLRPRGLWQHVRLTIDAQLAGLSAIELARRLRSTDPPVYLFEAHADRGLLGIDPFGLEAGNEKVLVERIREQLAP